MWSVFPDHSLALCLPLLNFEAIKLTNNNMNGAYTAASRNTSDDYDDRPPSMMGINNKPSNDEKASQNVETIEVPVIAQTASVPVTTSTTILTGMTNSTSEPEPRQGQKCCGCCCDYRRAVIIVNLVIIILEAIVFILAATGSLGYVVDTGAEGTDLLDKYSTTEMIFSAVSIVLCGVAIGGAYSYNIIMVGLNVLWLVVGYVLGIFLVINFCNDYCDEWEAYYDNSDNYASCYCYVNGAAMVLAAVVMVLWIYPHVGFIVQVRKGVMSKDTYAREQFSCCCV